MGDEKKEMLDIAAGGTGEGAEHRKKEPKKDADLNRPDQGPITPPPPNPKDDDDAA